MLGHTNLLVEFLISGMLVLCAFILLAFGVISDRARLGILQGIASNAANLDKILAMLLLPAISLAYAVGILSEIATRNAFDKYISKHRLRHLIAFLRANRDLLTTSPLLKKYTDAELNDMTITDSSAIGEMRFVVMMKNERLYKEIEAQINQLRILRVMFVFLTVTVLSLLIILARQIAGEYTVLAGCGLIVTIALLAIDFYAIRNRYYRYWRAVAYSYKALLAHGSDTPVKM